MKQPCPLGQVLGDWEPGQGTGDWDNLKRTTHAPGVSPGGVSSLIDQSPIPEAEDRQTIHPRPQRAGLSADFSKCICFSSLFKLLIFRSSA